MAGLAQTNTACINAPSRKLFAPMFKARWQNMQNIVNDSAFIDLMPESYLTYYMAFTRQCLQWASGFVPALHRQDFFSTGIGYTVVDILARECMNGGYRFESADKELLNRMEHWKKDVNLDNELYRMFWNSNAGGNAFIALTPNDGEIYPVVYPVNRCPKFAVNRRGIITSAFILNRFTAGETAYYTKEIRLLLKGKPFYKVVLAKGTLVTSPTWTGSTLKTVPDEISEQFEYTYGEIELNTWYKLPESVSGVGVYNIRNKPVSVAIADMPAYSDSSLYSALDILYAIDFDYTQAQVDMYMGKSRALIPKQFGGGNAVINVGGRPETVVDGISFSEAIHQPALKDDFYTEIFTANGEPVKPTFMQADLRGEQHKFIRDSYLEMLASKVGLSSSTLANHLQYNHDKTATQIEDEQTTTEKTVNQKRALITDELNRMFTDVAKFYGYDNACIEIAWGRAGSNTTSVNDELLNDYKEGVLPLRKYLKKRWSDLSEEEVEEWATEIEAEQQKKAERDNFGGGMFDDKDYFGSGEVNDNEDSAGAV